MVELAISITVNVEQFGLILVRSDVELGWFSPQVETGVLFPNIALSGRSAPRAHLCFSCFAGERVFWAPRLCTMQKTITVRVSEVHTGGVIVCVRVVMGPVSHWTRYNLRHHKSLYPLHRCIDRMTRTQHTRTTRTHTHTHTDTHSHTGVTQRHVQPPV